MPQSMAGGMQRQGSGGVEHWYPSAQHALADAHMAQKLQDTGRWEHRERGNVVDAAHNYLANVHGLMREQAAQASANARVTIDTSARDHRQFRMTGYAHQTGEGTHELHSLHADGAEHVGTVTSQHTADHLEDAVNRHIVGRARGGNPYRPPLPLGGRANGAPLPAPGPGNLEDHSPRGGTAARNAGGLPDRPPFIPRTAPPAAAGTAPAAAGGPGTPAPASDTPTSAGTAAGAPADAPAATSAPAPAAGAAGEPAENGVRRSADPQSREQNTKSGEPSPEPPAYKQTKEERLRDALAEIDRLHHSHPMARAQLASLRERVLNEDETAIGEVGAVGSTASGGRQAPPPGTLWTSQSPHGEYSYDGATLHFQGNDGRQHRIAAADNTEAHAQMRTHMGRQGDRAKSIDAGGVVRSTNEQGHLVNETRHGVYQWNPETGETQVTRKADGKVFKLEGKVTADEFHANTDRHHAKNEAEHAAAQAQSAGAVPTPPVGSAGASTAPAMAAPHPADRGKPGESSYWKKYTPNGSYTFDGQHLIHQGKDYTTNEYPAPSSKHALDIMLQHSQQAGARAPAPAAPLIGGGLRNTGGAPQGVQTSRSPAPNAGRVIPRP